MGGRDAQERADAASEGESCLLAVRRRAWRVASMADRAREREGENGEEANRETQGGIGAESKTCRSSVRPLPRPLVPSLPLTWPESY